MKRKVLFIIIVAILIMAMIFPGCTEQTTTTNTDTTPAAVKGPKLIKIGSYYEENSRVSYTFVYDPDTLVEYVLVYVPYELHNSGYSITPLYNADGSLKLYNPDNTP